MCRAVRVSRDRQGGKVCGGKKKKFKAIFSFPLTVAAPDLLDPKSATHNTKPRLSFSTKPITLTPREDSEVREKMETQTDKVICKKIHKVFIP